MTSESKMEQSPQTPPAVICANDRAVLEYALLDHSVGFREGHGLLFVGGKEIGRLPCLAICQDRNSGQVTLYFCDSGWNPIGIAVLDSVSQAKKKAERIYPGSSARWIATGSE
jgi:hypothetical protein